MHNRHLANIFDGFLQNVTLVIESH